MARAREKGALKPTSLTYTQALEEKLCFGWIDGQACGDGAFPSLIRS